MITEQDLYAIGMESQTAYEHMEELCKALDIPFPPLIRQRASKRELPDPFQESAA